MIRLLSFLLLAAMSLGLSGQTDQLREDWLQKDLQRAQDLFDFEAVSGLKAGEAWTAPVPKRGIVSVESRDLGFGAVLHRIDWIGGYTHHQAEILDFEGSVVEYRFTVEASGASWPLIRHQIKDAWSSLAVGTVEPIEEGLSLRRRFEPTAVALRQRTTAGLSVVPIRLPRRWQSAYEAATSPYSEVEVGVLCGFAPVVQEETRFIEWLVGREKVEILEAMLGGQSPEGRILAVLGLRALQRQGHILPSRTEAAMTRIQARPERIRYCSGCIGSTETASSAISRFEGEHSDWP